MSLTNSLPRSDVPPPPLSLPLRIHPTLLTPPHPPPPSAGPVVYDDGALRVIYIIMLHNGRGWRDGRGGERGREDNKKNSGGLEKASSLNVSALN